MRDVYRRIKQYDSRYELRKRGSFSVRDVYRIVEDLDSMKDLRKRDV